MLETWLRAIMAPVEPALGNHLWQSTVFLAVTGLFALLLRNNHARVRHNLWLAASVKFLIPFAPLIVLGAHASVPRRLKPLEPAYFPAVQEVSQPFTKPPNVEERRLPRALATDWRYRLLPAAPAIFVVVWLGGSLLVLAGWWGRWRELAIAIRSQEPLARGRELEALRRVARRVGLRKPIDAVLSVTSLEPGILGIVRPVLVWPSGLSEHLQDAHLDAILAHELEHVRRRDGLAATIHMAVEAIFWFHPLVWWLGARLVEERERACDEEVLHMVDEPRVYAEGILKTCRFCVEAPLACVSGISGGGLRKRIARIMTPGGAKRLSFGRKLMLATAAILVVAGPVIFGAVIGSTAHAQSSESSAEPLPSFEVVTIKPNRSNIISTKYAANRYSATDKNVSFFIKMAYGSSASRVAFPLRDDQVTGGPGWISSKYFDVDATIADAMAEQFRQHPEQLWGQLRLMLRSMLAERFKLQVSHTTEERSAFALVAGKNGPKFLDQKMMPGDSYPSLATPNQPTRGKPCVPKPGWACMARFMSMGDLAVLLSGLPEMPRPVMDQTGLPDTYFIQLEYAHPRRAAALLTAQDHSWPDADSAPPPPSSTGPSLFDALEKQLGLKLEPTRGPVDVLVIDHIEMPTEN